jgi:hypothetical protein
MAYTALIIRDESVSVTLDGKTTTIPADAPNFDALCALIQRQASDSEISQVLTPAVQIKSVAAKAGFEIRINEFNGAVGVFVNDIEVNSKLSGLLIDLYTAGNDFTALRAFMIKALANHDAKEVDVLYDFVINNKLPIHPDGDFLAFKATRKDGFDKHTGTVQYRIGEYLHVKNFDPNIRTQCGSGLHVGGRNYVDGYGNVGDALWLVKVDPGDTIYYRADVSDGKMRVKKLFVFAQIAEATSLGAFIPFMVVTSPEGDALEASAKLGKESKETTGRSAKVAKQAAKGRTKTEKKVIKAAKKVQTFVTETSKGLTFTTREGVSYTAKKILSGVLEHGQRGFSTLTGIPRTTLQGWVTLIQAGAARKR